MVNPEWLKYFQVLAETLNVTTAAERLHISPQGLSSALTGLEAHYGQRLVERSRRLTGLTPAGEALLEEIPRILHTLEDVDRRLARLRAGEPEGPLAIASVSYVNNYWLSGLLSTLVARCPKLQPRLYTMRGAEVEQWVAEGKLDVGVLTRPPTRTDLDVMVGLESPYLIVATPQPKRAWHELGYIAARQFSPEPSPVEGCASEQHLGGPWPEGNFVRRIVAETDYLETALSLCLAGVGAAFLPEIGVRRYLEAGQLAVVADAPAEYHERIYVVWRKGVRLFPELRETLSVLEASASIA